MKNGHMNKGKWLGKYVQNMFNLTLPHDFMLYVMFVNWAVLSDEQMSNG